MSAASRPRALALGAALLGAAMAWTPPAGADLWGGDLPLLSGILTESIGEVSNLANMLTELVEQVRLMKTSLSGLDSGSFAALGAFLQSAETSASTLTAGVHAMTYSLSGVDRQFEALFPADTSALTFAEHAPIYAGWNEEVLAASQIASRQQTAIEQLAASASKASDLAAQSKAASGEVAELQLVVQMLAIVHAQLTTMNQTLATTGRVLTDLAAVSASSSQLSQTNKQNSLSNYTARGASVAVPTRLP